MCVSLTLCILCLLLCWLFVVTPHGREQLKSTATELTPSTLQALHNGRLSFICFWAVKMVP